jgi:CBS domain-containing membrane protein
VTEATIRTTAEFFGVEVNTTSHTEKLVSGLGGVAGILAVVLVSKTVLDDLGTAFMVASMGATAVLLFAVPHGALSQPWPVLGGHAVSALLGVSCARFVPEAWLAAPLAVGLAIAAMHYLRCIHPPGGATALVAVVGGVDVHGLGYAYVLTPVLLNAAVILGAAVAFNYPLRWRRYPAALLRRPRAMPEAGVPEEVIAAIANEDLEYAMRQLDSFVDVTEGELARIYMLAAKHSQSQHLPAAAVAVGRFYSNGKYGKYWSVRQVVDAAGQHAPEQDIVIYKVVAGEGRRSSGKCTRAELALWARYEVYLDETTWRRVD